MNFAVSFAMNFESGFVKELSRFSFLRFSDAGSCGTRAIKNANNNVCRTTTLLECCSIGEEEQDKRETNLKTFCISVELFGSLLNTMFGFRGLFLIYNNLCRIV